MSFGSRFFNLGHPDRIWVISAVHGQLPRLTRIHAALAEKFAPGDKVVYTGNYLCGPDARPLQTLDALLGFREELLSVPSVEQGDIVHLRGIQEELFSKLLQLQFAQNAEQVVEWVSRHHPDMDCLLAACGTSLGEASRISREGILCLTKWSNAIKARMREHGEAYEHFFTHLRRAAFTDYRESNDNNLLFVHAGLNPHLPLASQGDSFWWASRHFNEIEERYAPFRAVIRGHDPERKGIHVGKATISLDGGCGFGGKLVLAQMSNTGEVLELIAA
jgi:serine/threonine protein phosphatase 1